MIDLSILRDDPLVVILGVLALGGLVAHFLFKKHPLGRAIVRVVFLILLTIAFLHADIVPYQPLELGDAVSRCGPRNTQDRLVALGSMVSGRRAARGRRLRAQPA